MRQRYPYRTPLVASVVARFERGPLLRVAVRELGRTAPDARHALTILEANMLDEEANLEAAATRW